MTDRTVTLGGSSFRVVGAHEPMLSTADHPMREPDDPSAHLILWRDRPLSEYTRAELQRILYSVATHAAVTEPGVSHGFLRLATGKMNWHTAKARPTPEPGAPTELGEKR